MQSMKSGQKVQALMEIQNANALGMTEGWKVLDFIFLMRTVGKTQTKVRYEWISLFK